MKDGHNRTSVGRGHAGSASIGAGGMDASSPKVNSNSVNRRINKSLRGNLNEYQDIFNSVQEDAKQSLILQRSNN